MQATPRSCLLMPGLSTCTVCITRWRWLCVRRITTPSVRVGCWFVGSSWIARGFKLEEFSKDKMMEIWDKEDEDEMEMQTAMGLNNLAEKMEIIQAEKDAQWNLPRLARDVRQALGRMAVSTAKGAKDGAVATMWKTLYTVEPTFMRRCVRLRQPCGAQLSARGALTTLLPHAAGTGSASRTRSGTARTRSTSASRQRRRPRKPRLLWRHAWLAGS